MSDESFADAVARRAKVSAAEVNTALEVWNVPQSPMRGRRRAFRVERIAFHGLTQGAAKREFGFDRRFGSGVFAIAGEKNDIGKTTVIEILRWAVRGEPDVQADVREWLSDVRVEALLGDTPVVIEFDCQGGHVTTGAVTFDTSTTDFVGTEEHKACVDDLFMDQLGLVEIDGRSETPGEAVRHHRWAAYSYGLFLMDPDSKLMFAPATVDGLPGRLVQMFMGVPWAVPSIELGRAIKEHKAATTAATAQPVTNFDTRRAELNALLTEPLEVPPDVETKRAEWRAAVDHVDALRDTREEARIVLTDARRSRLDARRALQIDADSTAAAGLFRGLEPHACPRCRTAIDDGRRQTERDEHHCAICTRELPTTTPTSTDDEESPALTDDLLAAATDANDSAVNDASDRLAEIGTELRAAVLAVDEALEALTAAEQAAAQLAGKQMEVAAARGELDALDRLIAAAPDRPQVTAPDATHLRILNVAKAEADERRRAATTALSDSIDSSVLERCRNFGLNEYQSTRVDLVNGAVTVGKGGATTSFAKVTGGEKVRLRIAALAAFLNESSRAGTCRHPGFLAIDSLGREEVEEGVQIAFLKGLVATCAAVDGMQVILTSAEPDLIAKVLTDDHIVGPDYQTGTIF